MVILMCATAGLENKNFMVAFPIALADINHSYTLWSKPLPKQAKPVR